MRNPFAAFVMILAGLAVWFTVKEKSVAPLLIAPVLAFLARPFLPPD